MTTGRSLYLHHLKERSPGEIGREQGLAPYYPVLIIPGFMSSGLTVVESKLKAGWVGERAWLSIQKLGFGGAVEAHNNQMLAQMANQSASATTLTPPGGPSPIRSNSLTPSALSPPLPVRASSSGGLSPTTTNLERSNNASSTYSGVSAASERSSVGRVSSFAGDPGAETDAMSNLSASLPRTGASGVMQRAWLTHIALGHDARSDPAHCLVRPMAGLEGVDFLQSGFLMEMGTYVFGPVIRELVVVGYKPGFNLEAAPYDWRLPPADLEARDGYFSKLAATVERLCKGNKNVPVVLLAHSMGTRIAHYFSNWAHQKLGEAWCARNIHSVVAVGGPWLGAGKSGRGPTTGDSMGVPFLKPEECIWFSRRLGSPPLLFPVCASYYNFLSPHFAAGNPPNHNDVTFCFVKQESYISVTLNSLSLTAGTPTDRRYYIQIEWRGRKMRSEGSTFFSPATGTMEWSEQQRFQLPTEQFAKLVPGSSQSIIKFTLFSEKSGPDVTIARCEVDLAAELRARTGRTEVAIGDDAKCIEEWDGLKLFAVGSGDGATIVAHLSATAVLKVPGEPGKRTPVPGWSALKPQDAYSPTAISDLLVEDGALALYTLWEEVYKADPLCASSLAGGPPKGIKRWHIVYSTGRKTEVGFCVRRRFGRITKGPDGVAWNYYKLDKGPKSVPGSQGRLVCQDGIIFETQQTPQPSITPNQTATNCGDGTVPYISLIHPFTWRTKDPSLEVTSHHILGAEHRGMLAEKAFLSHLLEYVCARPKGGLKEVKPITTREKVSKWFN